MKQSDIPIPLPCSENWDTMTREGRKLFCDKCKKHVHDLTRMTEEETRALLAQRGESELCVRYLHDAFGNLVFGMVDTSIIAPSRLVRARRAVVAAAATLSVSATMACGGAQKNEEHMLGGAIACPMPSTSATVASDPVPVATSPAAAPTAPATSTPIPVATSAQSPKKQ